MKSKLGRKVMLPTGMRQIARSLTLDDAAYGICVKFGHDKSASEGVRRMAKIIAKFRLWEKTDAELGIE